MRFRLGFLGYDVDARCPKWNIFGELNNLCVPVDMQTKKQLVQFWGIAAQIFALASYFERMSFCCYKIAINYSLAIWYFHFRLPVDWIKALIFCQYFNITHIYTLQTVDLIKIVIIKAK